MAKPEEFSYKQYQDIQEIVSRAAWSIKQHLKSLYNHKGIEWKWNDFDGWQGYIDGLLVATTNLESEGKFGFYIHIPGKESIKYSDYVNHNDVEIEKLSEDVHSFILNYQKQQKAFFKVFPNL